MPCVLIGLVQQFGSVTSAKACVRSRIVIHRQKPSVAEISVTIYKHNCVMCCSPILHENTAVESVLVYHLNFLGRIRDVILLQGST